MRYLLLILLCISASLNGQYKTMHQGSPVSHQGVTNLRVRPIDIPTISEDKRGSKGGDDEFDWDTHTETDFYWDLTESTVGYYSESSMYTDVIAAGADTAKLAASNAWSGSVSSTYHPHVVSSWYDSSGVILPTQAVRFTMPPGIGSKPPSDPYYIPINARIHVNTGKKRRMLRYDFKLTGVGWQDILSSDEVKMTGICAGLDDSLTIVNMGGDGNHYVRQRLMMKGDSPNKIRWVTYPRADVEGYNTYLMGIVQNLREHDDTATVLTTSNADTSWHEVAIILTIDEEPYDSSGTMEWFIDGYKAMELHHAPLYGGDAWGYHAETDSISLSSISDMFVDGILLAGHWGGAYDEHPDNGPAQQNLNNIWMRDITDEGYSLLGIEPRGLWPWDTPLPEPPWSHYWK